MCLVKFRFHVPLFLTNVLSILHIFLGENYHAHFRQLTDELNLRK